MDRLTQMAREFQRFYKEAEDRIHKLEARILALEESKPAPAKKPALKK